VQNRENIYENISLIVVSASHTLSFHIFGVSQADGTTITITGARGPICDWRTLALAAASRDDNL